LGEVFRRRGLAVFDFFGKYFFETTFNGKEAYYSPDYNMFGIIPIISAFIVQDEQEI